MNKYLQREIHLAFLQPPVHSSSDFLISCWVSFFYLAMFELTNNCYAIAFAKGMRDFYRVTALALSNKLHKNALNPLN